METWVILNPKAGQGRAGQQLEAAACLAGQGVTWVETDRPGAARDLAREAAEAGCQTLVAAGGDGTVNEVLNGLLEIRQSGRPIPALGILPLGSANDFASGLGLPATIPLAYERIMVGQTRSIDIGRIENDTGQSAYFGLGSGLGFIGQAAMERHRIRYVRGSWLYVLASLRTLRKYRPPERVRFELDDTVIEQPILTIFINNCPSIGGVPLTPGAKMDDGLFDIVIVPIVGKVRLIQLMLKLQRGQHLEEPEFQLVQGRRLRVSYPEGCPVHIDGETAVFERSHNRKLDIRLLPRILEVLV